MSGLRDGVSAGLEPPELRESFPPEGLALGELRREQFERRVHRPQEIGKMPAGAGLETLENRSGQEENDRIWPRKAGNRQ